MDRSPGEISGRAVVLAVFGCPIDHSRSPVMHNAAIRALGLDAVYVPFRVEPGRLPEAIAGMRALGMGGVNLTIPLKEMAVALVDRLSPEAQRIGAVNTLWWDNDMLAGHSTDGEGFLRSLQEFQGGLPRRALVLGAGGSARAVCFALADHGVKITIANRTLEKGQKIAVEIARIVQGSHPSAISTEPDDLRDAVRHSDLIVNCTSVGMGSKADSSPLPPDCIDGHHVVYDLIYNPSQTRLLVEAREKGARVLNGVDMLVHQGALSFELWTGIAPPLDVMKNAVQGTL
ncbi:MAG: shikimate dehydrogenase [Armatimonadetes bacterium]|nr:shikimate dehydrogenase [Armatimonadota bacterium]